MGSTRLQSLADDDALDAIDHTGNAKRRVADGPWAVGAAAGRKLDMAPARRSPNRWAECLAFQGDPWMKTSRGFSGFHQFANCGSTILP